MLIYLASIALILLIWRIRDYFGKDILRDYSNNSVPLLKNAFSFASVTPDELFMFPRDCASKFKRSYRHKFFGMLGFEICRARDAERILGSSKHINKSRIYNLLHPFLKTGLLTSNGEKWHTRRRLLTPAFHFDILKEFGDIFREESDKLVESLEKEVGKVLDIIPVSSQFTLNTICESAMGVKLSDLGDDGISYRRNLYAIGKKLVFRLLRPWLLPNLIFSALGYQKEFDEVLQPVHEFTKSIIKERKQTFATEMSSTLVKDENENVYFRTRKRRYAMMDTLLQAQRNGLIEDNGIIEETDTFTFEGHDTTSAAMTFILLLLAHHPEAQEKIFKDIQEVLAEGSKDELSIDDFNKMEYLDWVIKESLRLYPPVPFISRELSEDMLQDGVLHPKGIICNIHIFDVHRDPEIFPDPEKFDPDRFSPENCVNRNNFAFIAFSAGMRNCIGQRFAMLELKLMVTKLVSKFKISPFTSREEIVFIADIVLRSKNPIEMIFSLR